MKKAITALSLVAALFTSSSVPATSASPAAPEPPAACAGLVQDFAAKLKQAVGALVPTPDVAAVKPLIGDLLVLLTAMQNAGCVPAPPVSPPSAPSPAKAFESAAAPEECLAAVLNVISGVAGLGGAVLGGADAAKITELLKALLQTVNDTLGKCGLPVPPGGMPAMPPAAG